MKKVIPAITLLMLLLSASCIQFDEFNRIEENKLRVIGVSFGPAAEFAPGDTITVRAYFAGDSVVSVGDFSLAYTKKVKTIPTFPDERSIAVLESILWLPDSMQFRYVIPDEVFVQEKLIEKKDPGLVKQVVSLIKLNEDTNGELFENMSDDSLYFIFEMVSEIASRGYFFFHAHSKNGTNLKIAAECIIRYNAMFPDFLPVNRNPRIKVINLYRVPSAIDEEFSPGNTVLAGQYERFWLYNEFYPDSVIDTVVIDTGFTFFLGGDRGINTWLDSNGQEIHDTTIDIVEFELGDIVITEKEIYDYMWFYQNLDNVSKDPDSLLIVDPDGTWPSLAWIEPPLDIDMKHFRIWLMVYDEFPGEIVSSKGYAMRTVDGVFKFTDAYKKSLKKGKKD